MRWLLRLYPQSWRERYESEMLALLEEHTVTPATVLDLVIGALDANLHYDGFSEGVIPMVNRLRSGMIMVFCAFMLFGVGWGMLQRLTDPMPVFQSANQMHPAIGLLCDSVAIGGMLAFLAFLMGGLPIFFISVKRAYKNERRDALIPFWVALSCLVLFMMETAVLADWHQLALVKHHFIGFILTYLALVAMELVVGTVSVSLTIARTDFQLRELKFMFIPEVVVLFGMIVSAVLSIVLIILVTAYAPQLFSTQDVTLPTFTTGILLMGLATVFATMGVKRTMVRGMDQIS